MEGALTPSLPRISELLPALAPPSACASRGLPCTLGCCTLASSCVQMLGRLGPLWVLPHVSMLYLKHQTVDLLDANIFAVGRVSARALLLHHTQLPTGHEFWEGGETGACKAREASRQSSFLLSCFQEQPVPEWKHRLLRHRSAAAEGGGGRSPPSFRGAANAVGLQ